MDAAEVGWFIGDAIASDWSCWEVSKQAGRAEQNKRE